jgi:hypothetical protein
MSYSTPNGGEVSGLPATDAVMPRSLGGEPCQEGALPMPEGQMPLHSSDGTNHMAMPTPLSVDSPLPGRAS